MDVPYRLVEALAERRVVPFLGAGFSIPSGVRPWGGLMDGLRQRYHRAIGDAVSGVAPQLNAIDLASVLDALNLTENEVRTYFAEQVGDSRLKPSTYHRMLSELAPSTVITTNWDRLLEDQFKHDQVAARVLYRDADVPFFDTARLVNILKVHGTVDDISSMVYKSSHYDPYWRDRPVLGALLTTLLSTNSALFIGYGFGDPNIESLLDQLARSMGAVRREHWALSYSGSPTDRLWQRLGVRVIRADAFSDDPDDWQGATQTFLELLAQSTGSVSYTNLERAQLVNKELQLVTSRDRPASILRMRGALGWLSNPIPTPGDAVYGSDEQDVAERTMTERVVQHLTRHQRNRVRNLLHLSSLRLVGRYEARHIRRRLETLAEMISAYPTQVEVAHTPSPNDLNEMLLNEHCSILGFKTPGALGIRRVTVGRDPRAVRNQAEQFDAEFWEAIGLARGQPVKVGDEASEAEALSWSRSNVLSMIEGELRRLEHIEESATADGSDQNDFVGAIRLAIESHDAQGQTREDGTTPYWVHPLRVVERLRAVGGVEDYAVLSAAVLHDVVEDTDVTPQQLKAKFGARVAMMVDHVTRKEGQSTSAYMAQLRSASTDGVSIKLADRWDNVWELRTMKYPSYGGEPPLEYIDEADELLGACAHGTTRWRSDCNQRSGSRRRRSLSVNVSPSSRKLVKSPQAP